MIEPLLGMLAGVVIVFLPQFLYYRYQDWKDEQRHQKFMKEYKPTLNLVKNKYSSKYTNKLKGLFKGKPNG